MLKHFEQSQGLDITVYNNVRLLCVSGKYEEKYLHGSRSDNFLKGQKTLQSNSGMF